MVHKTFLKVPRSGGEPGIVLRPPIRLMSVRAGALMFGRKSRILDEERERERMKEKEHTGPGYQVRLG